MANFEGMRRSTKVIDLVNYKPPSHDKYLNYEEDTPDTMFSEIERRRAFRWRTSDNFRHFLHTRPDKNGQSIYEMDGIFTSLHINLYCYNSTPYKVTIIETEDQQYFVNFLSEDLVEVFRGIVTVLSSDNDHTNVNVPVWGCSNRREILKIYKDEITQTLHMRQLLVDRSDKHLNRLGLQKVISKVLPASGIYVDLSESVQFLKMIYHANVVINLLLEIEAQRHATFSKVSDLFKNKKDFNDEEYTACVIKTFYSLKISEEDLMPAHVVLNSFFGKRGILPCSAELVI